MMSALPFSNDTGRPPRGWFQSRLQISQHTWKTLLKRLITFLHAHPRIIRHLETVFHRSALFQLMMSEYHRSQRDHLAAFRTLVLAQRHRPGHLRLLLRIADMFRQDGRYPQALALTRLVADPTDTRLLSRQLTLATDGGLYAYGSRALAHLLNRPISALIPHLSAINRHAVYYPEQDAAIRQFRQQIRNHLCDGDTRGSDRLSLTMEICLVNRWITDAERLFRRFPDRTRSSRDALRDWFARIQRDLGFCFDVLDMALDNEERGEPETLQVRYNGRSMPLGDVPVAENPPVVELFFPTPFFSPPWDEKPTYNTVRSVYGTIVIHILSRADTVVVPRMQFNWRACRPLTRGKVISYHTHSLDRGYQRLHIQEAPLVGHCSMDPKGFAGFSSIATDPEAIVRVTRDVSETELEKTAAELRRRFVDGNVSKYAQREDRTMPLPADYVLVALQISTDVVASLAFMDGLTLLARVAHFYETTSTAVVVKRHPYCQSISVQRKVDQLAADGKIILCDDSIHHLIDGASCVFVVNSGTGLEALLHEKPVVVCGHCDYADAAHPARTPEELDALLRHPPTADRHRIRRFLYYYWRHYLVHSENRMEIRRRLETWLEASTDE